MAIHYKDRLSASFSNLLRKRRIYIYIYKFILVYINFTKQLLLFKRKWWDRTSFALLFLFVLSTILKLLRWVHQVVFYNHNESKIKLTSKSRLKSWSLDYWNWEKTLLSSCALIIYKLRCLHGGPGIMSWHLIRQYVW